jgi:nucleoside-diphosphate-sugar epimerase
MARIFLAGASGLIGQQLVKLLVRAGHQVTGTTRTESRTGLLRGLGATPVVVDAFDREALGRVVLASRPEIVLHQLTSLPDNLLSLDGADLERALRENARMRTEGTANLVAAASTSGARRLVAQSILWIYAPGPEPHLESDPVNIEAQGLAAVTIRGVVANERAVLGAPMQAVVLRNGRLYGPGTGQDTAMKDPAVHVDAAARAAFLAVERGSGVYNVADPGKYASSEKARRELGWDAAFRL